MGILSASKKEGNFFSSRSISIEGQLLSKISSRRIKKTTTTCFPEEERFLFARNEKGYLSFEIPLFQIYKKNIQTRENRCNLRLLLFSFSFLSINSSSVAEFMEMMTGDQKFRLQGIPSVGMAAHSLPPIILIDRMDSGRRLSFQIPFGRKTERAIIHSDWEARIRRIGPDCFSHAFDCNEIIALDH